MKARTIIIACMVAVIAICLYAAKAKAADDGRWANAPPHVKQWFNRQKNARGDLCCDETEAREVEDWSHDRTGYRVTIAGKSYLVDPLALNLTRSITGEPLVWIYPRGAPVSTSTIRCFIPGDEG